jgi:hypothetical protein
MKHQKQFFVLTIFLLWSLLFAAEIPDSLKSINDGPYIFITESGLEVHTIEAGKHIQTTENLPVTITVPKVNFEIDVITTDFDIQPFEYKDVSEIFILSDIHGQFDSFVKLLKNGNVIDDKLNWIFGEGHLVIIGDVFDRGDTETECLWLIYKLEREAWRNGGQVHFTYGNHEIMVMQNDLRYLNEKYIQTAEMMNIQIERRYDANSFLGKWLRTKNTIVEINNMLLCHAGISCEIYYTGIKPRRINSLIRDNIGTKRDMINSDKKLSLLFKSKGPIWYRGYFGESEDSGCYRDFAASHSYKKIIVGHTTQDSIISIHKNLIIAVDAGLKYDDKGQALHWKEGVFYVIDIDNKRKIFN